MRPIEMKTMRRLLLMLMVLVLATHISCLSFAKESPESLKNEAIHKIRAAQELIERANMLARHEPGKFREGDLGTAIQLYAEAGKLFEEAGNIFKFLGPEYTSQEDIDGCGQAVESCVDAIRKIKKVLGYE